MTELYLLNRMTLAILAGMLVGLYLEFEPLSAQQMDHSYQAFSNSISPAKLNQLLGSSNAVQKKLVSDKISQMVLEKFKTLTPKQRENLLKLARDLTQKSNDPDVLAQTREELEENISKDPDLKEAVEQMQSQFNQQNFAPDSINSQAIEKEIRQEIQNRLQRELSQLGSRSIPGNSSDSLTGGPFSQPPGGFPDSDASPGTSGRSGQGTAGPFRGGGNFSGPPRQPVQNSPQPGTNFSGPNFSSPDALKPPQQVDSKSKLAVPRNGNGQASAPKTGDSMLPSGGFSDDGRLGNRPLPSDPGVASASGQKEKPPEDSLGHRFNRVLLESFEKAMERKLETDAISNNQSFRGLLNKFVESVSNSERGLASSWPSGGTSFLERLQSGVGRANSRIRNSGFNLGSMRSGLPSLGAGGGMSIPAVSPRAIVLFLLIAGAMVGFIVFLARRTSIGRVLGLQKEKRRTSNPPDLNVQILEQGEIVQLIDNFALWIFGRKASWWHTRKVQAEIAEISPALATEVRTMMKIYDEARYGNEQSIISPEEVVRVKTTLTQLRELSLNIRKDRRNPGQLVRPESV